ncbi:MAG: hypothetical protein IKS85_00485 [Lachnospiraceae bacterium]|nr:hypothetical protein [Lachnospiraceae bacterium]
MPKNYRCPGCGNTLEFFPEMGKMYCMYCGASYSVEELNAKLEPQKQEEEQSLPSMQPVGAVQAGAESLQTMGQPMQSAAQPYEFDGQMIDPAFASVMSPTGQMPVMPKEPLDPAREKEQQRRHATIEMQILHCNSCGAELAVNGVEVSSFCVYCGQATVVLDRVEEYLKPDYVMPFVVTKEQAELTIRTKITQGFYVPNDIKHFETEKLRGIYIPFWLYDMYYGDDQYWKYTVKRGKSTVTRYSHRLAECRFHKLTLDASKNFNDNSSQRLEPYHMDSLKEFDPMYLSGFYADRFDVGMEDTETLATFRAKEMFNEAVQATVHHGGAKLQHTSPVHKVLKREYGLLPVWFLTFHNGGFPYTIMVNGQTGKMVGAVPFVKAKVIATFALLAIVLCGTLIPGLAFATNGILTGDVEGKTIAGYFSFLAIAIVFVWKGAVERYRAMQDSVALTRSGTASRFVRERADR